MIIVINDEEERWVDLVYENVKDKYEISNYGNIRFKDTHKRINILKYDYNKYNMVSLQVSDGHNETFFIHTLVASNFIENPKCGSDPDTKYIVNHKDSDTKHNYYKNLEWISYWDNTKHGLIHGNIEGTIINENGDKLIYDEIFINKILELLQDGKTPIEICSKLNIDDKISKQIKSLIKDLKRGRTHKDISKNYNINHEKRNLFPLDTVREICKLLEKGYTKDQIFNELKVKPEELDLYNRKFYAITHDTEFKSITKDYNFPRVKNIFNTYSSDLIHDICKLLQDSYSRDQIIDILKLNNDHKTRALIYDIYTRRSHVKISKNYIW